MSWADSTNTISVSPQQIQEIVRLVVSEGDALRAWRAAQPDDIPYTLKDGPAPWLGEGQRYHSKVTEKDPEIEGHLREGLHRIVDGAGIEIVGEEEMAQQERAVDTSKPCFYIDPIDGTSNFTNKGSKYYSIQVGLVEGGKPVAGVSYYPEFGEVFFTLPDRRGEMQAYSLLTRQDEMLDFSQKQLCQIKPWHGNGALLMTRQAYDGFKEAKMSLPEDAAAIHYTGEEKDGYYGDFFLLTKQHPNVRLARYPLGGFEWDFAARQAILQAAGAAFCDMKTGEPPRYTATGDFYHPPVWLGHPDTLKAIDAPMSAKCAGCARGC